MDIEELKKLVKLVEKSDIKELEIEEEGRKIRIVKGGQEAAPMMPMQYMQPVQQAAPPAAAARTAAPAAPGTEAAAEAEDDGKYHNVKSPMVGTFYRASAEDAEPFAKEGDIVSKGQTLCIIEAMKLMNEIESDIGGRVVKILAENGSPVEFGETLFKIEPV
ncbi:MAG: acetyl-CoA carboxylase biotin carboxyl carrier protein [Nitrospinae bacterium]|nr:acetyl-CoA carboxylase biotin carboxyl carrier protein [Nitrospinota bacterium]